MSAKNKKKMAQKKLAGKGSKDKRILAMRLRAKSYKIKQTYGRHD
jgi:hypothetical protein